LSAISDTITGTPVWTVGSSLTKDSQSNTTTTTSAVISGGLVGMKEPLSCKITTAGGRTDERTIYLKIIQR
jgi:proline racemase